MERQKAIRVAVEALKKAKNSRWYCADSAIYLALGALVSEWAAARDGEPFGQSDVVKFLERLRPYAPSLFQQRPPPEPPELDLSKWKDPVSGATPPNPYAKSTLNLSEQAWLTKNEPALARYLQGVAESGVSYSYLAKQRAEKAKNEKVRELQYGELEHRNNVYRWRNMTKHNEFARTNPDLADFYKREAETEVTVPWLGNKPNLTHMGWLAKGDPDLHSLVKASTTTAQQWARSVLHEAKAQQTSAETILEGDTLLGR